MDGKEKDNMGEKTREQRLLNYKIIFLTGISI